MMMATKSNTMKTALMAKITFLLKSTFTYEPNLRRLDHCKQTIEKEAKNKPPDIIWMMYSDLQSYFWVIYKFVEQCTWCTVHHNIGILYMSVIFLWSNEQSSMSTILTAIEKNRGISHTHIVNINLKNINVLLFLDWDVFNTFITKKERPANWKKVKLDI